MARAVSVSSRRARSRVSARASTNAAVPAMSDPLLWAMMQRSRSTPAAASRMPRAGHGVARRDASNTAGQNAARKSAALAFS